VETWRSIGMAGNAMTEAAFITPDLPENKGADYAWLKEEGTRLVQELSGAIWTDYNEHDPGVTTLEQLCYALTELSYRAEFPLDGLLIDPRTGRIDTQRQALFVPRRILPGAALTQDDYRKLIVDRVREVANVWLTPHRPDSPRTGVDGLYDIAVYAPGADPCVCDGREHLHPDAIRERVRRVYCRHRCLCEDVHDIRILEPLPTVVAAVVAIDNSLAAEAILARLLFNLGNFLAPELRRLPLKALVEAGVEPSAIFDGPLLRHGFIDNAELQPKAKAILFADVNRVIVRSPGVMGAHHVTIRVGEQEVHGPAPAPIPVPDNQIPRLDTRPVDGRYPIRLFRNGIEVKPDPVRVERELDRLWSNQRQTYPLARQYQEYFAVPQGEFRDVKTYYSIQYQYPNVYGINSFGLPIYATTARKAQAKQLKAYLLPFEQLLADFFAQLANVRLLYSTDQSLTDTYFYQYLDSPGASVPEVVPLLRPDYRAGLARIVQDCDSFAARRNRFLDLLLALYAERLGVDLMPFVGEGGDAAERLIRAKLALLRHLVVAERARGVGFDYLAPPSPRNVAGMTIKSRIELGMPAFPRRPLADLLEELGLALAEDETQPTLGAALHAHAEHIEETFAPLDSLAEERDRVAREPEMVEHAAASLRGQRTSEAFVRALGGGDIRLGALPGDAMTAVACRAPGETEWRLAGKYASVERALAAIALLTALAEDLTLAFRQLYIVEHTLLRFGRGEDDAGEAPAQAENGTFVYSFTVTAVVSDAPGDGDVSGYRTGVREVIRRNAPAHIGVEYRFLRPHRMLRFEALHQAWRQALRRGDRAHIVATSRRLRLFLESTGTAADG
jgi:hypothetical protein